MEADVEKLSAIKLKALAKRYPPEDALVAHLIKTGLVGLTNDPRRPGAVMVEYGTGCRIQDAQGKDIRGEIRVRFSVAAAHIGMLFHRLARDHEGRIRWMYLDHKGNVTVGLGHLLPHVEAAVALPFFERGTLTPASKAHIANAYRTVKSSQDLRGNRAEAFKNLTHIDLPESDIDALFRSDGAEFIGQLRRRFSSFDSFPEPAQLALLDRIFNLGNTGFPGFVKLIAAVKFRNWALAAAESGIEVTAAGVAKRNEKIRKMFLQAAAMEPFFLDPAVRPIKLPRP